MSFPAANDKLQLIGHRVSPLDEANRLLVSNVRPDGWVNPKPSGRYNLVVIGAGAGGLVSAAGAAGVGARVAIVEEHLFGGDCLNVGCVPSKALIRCARAAHEARNLAEFGVHVSGDVTVDFGQVMLRMRQLRAKISAVDACSRFRDELGIDVFQGTAAFTSAHTIEVGGQSLDFAAAVIATGGRASIPPIPGLEGVGYMTNDSFYNQTELPDRLAVIGAGPIGLEMAQCMARFGSRTTVLSTGSAILKKDDIEAAAIVQKQLISDGISFRMSSSIKKIQRLPDGAKEMHVCRANGVMEVLVVDAVLVSIGRTPNVLNLGLEKCGVAFDEQAGIKTNDRMQTSLKHVFAVGDCCSQFQFTHVSDFMARAVIRNALFFGSSKFSSFLIPWATFTEPEVAHVGMSPGSKQAKTTKYDTFTRDLAEVDRAVLDGTGEGFVKVHVLRGTDKILGATIVSPDAGNLISEVTVAMQAGLGIGALANVIHPYPTQAEAIRQVGDLYNKGRLTPFVRKIFKALLRWRRS